MTHNDSLVQAFHVQNVRRIAIVDDGYDPPSLDGLGGSAIQTFRKRIEDVIEDEDPDGVGSSGGPHGIASLQEVVDRLSDPDYLPVLWDAYRTEGRDTPLGKLLHLLFSGYVVNRRDKLVPLERLEALVEGASGMRAVTFGGGARPQDLFEYDLIFLDYYLDRPAGVDPLRSVDGTSPEDGRDRSIDFLRELVALSPKRIPLVMLISSEATAGDIPEFRRRAKVLASAVQFLPKVKIEEDQLQAQAVLLGLVGRRLEIDALWELIDLWRSAVRAASDGLIEVVRELDLPDYGYLQNHRLTSERIPLAHYMVWLFNGHLSSLVEAKLHDVAVSKIVGNLVQSGAVPGRVAPTEAISALYASITTSYVPIRSDAFAPKAWAGDVFVRTDKWHEIGGDVSVSATPAFDHPMPEVLAVVTPACDLVPERSDRLRALSTIGGTLEPLLSAKEPSTHFIIVRDKQFHVSWDPKWPVTVPIEAVDGTSLLGGRYRWIGRLRDMYHADLQHMLASDLGRVGLPVVPTMPQWSALRVLAKIDGKFVEVLARTTADRAIWTVFSARKGADKTLQIREDIAWEVRSGILRRLGGGGDKHSIKLRGFVDSLDFVQKLQHPITLKKDSHVDPAREVQVRRATPNLEDDGGEGCDRLVVIVFGPDVARETDDVG